MKPIELIEFLATLPTDATVRQLLSWPATMHWHALCKHCERTIVNFGGDVGFEEGRPWYHATGSRGCRSASADGKDVDAEVYWDNSLDRRWMAAPGGMSDRDPYDDCHVCELTRSRGEDHAQTAED